MSETKLEVTAVLMSISQAAAEMAMARSTVSRAIDQLGIKPASVRSGYAVYRLRDLLAVALATPGPDGARLDPMLMRPSDRRAWYQSENERLSVEMQMGQLIPAGEVEFEFARMVKMLVQFLETLPDVLERDYTLSPEQIAGIHDAINRQRDELYKHMTETNLTPAISKQPDEDEHGT